MAHPLLIVFVASTTLVREIPRRSMLPIVRNGPPGTFVRFPSGLRVSLPTDQVVFADDSDGGVRVAFGGMEFVGVEGGQIVCRRVRELHPEDQLSPDRSYRMELDPSWIAAVFSGDRQVWPEPCEPH